MSISELIQFEQYLQQRRYSQNTIKAYREALKVFASFISPKSLSSIENRDLERFNYEYILKKGLSSSFQNQVINALKLYVKRFNSESFDFNAIERPIKGSSLPIILSSSETEQILWLTRNIKHKTMLMLIYCCGLRRSELIGMRIRDVDSDRMLIQITNSKGNKDRLVPLTQKMLKQLRMYYRMYRPKDFLFEGANGGKYSATSLQKVFKRSVHLAKINKRVTLHTLRHSYATHMLEAGVNLRYIQEILGHRSSKTTEIYTHVQSKDFKKLMNPMDNLKI